MPLSYSLTKAIHNAWKCFLVSLDVLTIPQEPLRKAVYLGCSHRAQKCVTNIHNASTTTCLTSPLPQPPFFLLGAFVTYPVGVEGVLQPLWRNQPPASKLFLLRGQRLTGHKGQGQEETVLLRNGPICQCVCKRLIELINCNLKELINGQYAVFMCILTSVLSTP